MAIFGAAAVTVALLLFAAGAQSESIALIVAGLALQGVGNGTAQPPLNATLANSVDEEDLGIASAAQRMAFQVGSSMGITVLTAVYGGDGTASSFTRAYIVGAMLGAAAIIAASAIRSTDRGSRTELLAAVTDPRQ